MVEADKLRIKMKKLAEELYSLYHPDFVPLFPRVLVYVLPREQRIGQLWVPDNSKGQNKVTLEGVVLKLWGKEKYIPIRYRSEDHDDYSEMLIETSLEVGDHILFSHHSGQPLSKETDKDFRVLKEFNVADATDLSTGEILGKVNYTTESVEKLFTKAYKKRYANAGTTDMSLSEEAIKNLMGQFVIYPKASKTLSGK